MADDSIQDRFRREGEQLRALGAALAGSSAMDSIEATIDAARTAAWSMLLDDGRHDAPAVLLAAANSPAGLELAEALVHAVLTSATTQDQRDRLAAVFAAGLVLGSTERRALARQVAALVALERGAVVVLQSLVVPFAGDAAWRQAHAAYLEEPERARRLAELRPLGLVDGDRATEIGRALVRAMGKVRR